MEFVIADKEHRSGNCSTNSRNYPGKIVNVGVNIIANCLSMYFTVFALWFIVFHFSSKKKKIGSFKKSPRSH